MATKPKAEPKGPDYEVTIGFIMWKLRHHLSGMAVHITQKDKDAFQQSLDYNEQTVKVNIEDRSGTTIVHLTDAKSYKPANPEAKKEEYIGDQIIVNENNEDDLAKQQAAANRRNLIQNVPMIVSGIRSSMAAGITDGSLIEDACQALMALIKA